MSAVSDILLAPEVRPFAVAAAIMAVLGGIELLTTLIGFSVSELLGTDVNVEADGHIAGRCRRKRRGGGGNVQICAPR